MVLRGGFGIFTDIFPSTVADDLLSNPPFSVTFQVPGLLAPAVPGSATSALFSSNQIFQTAYPAGAVSTPSARWTLASRAQHL
jgi:hypothetical protein